VATKAKKRNEGDLTISGVIAGVTLSRTLPPLLPANFLARRHLVEKIDVKAPGTTLITGPIGYGKTSLATEIAERYPDRTFWYTMVDEDSASKFNAYVIQSVRNVIPGFATWYEAEPDMDPMELIIRFSNELSLQKSEFIFIVDNRRTAAAEDFAIANQMIQSLPRNLHLIHIRRFTPDASAGELAPMGNLQIIGPSDLRFTAQEVESIAILNGLSPIREEISKMLHSAQGWPAAVQLIVRGLAKGETFNASAYEISSSVEPLRLIVEEVVKGLTDEEKILLEPLSAVNEFTGDLARRILESDYSQNKIDSLAAEGSLISRSTANEPVYKIHSLIRETLYLKLSKDETKLRQVHLRTSEYFEENLDATSAMEHAFLSQDYQRFEGLFRQSARVYAATGRGDDLLRWAKYAGDESTQGQLQRQTVEIAGHLANLDFAIVEAMNASMLLQSKGTHLELFMERYTSLIQTAVDYAFARFESLEKSVAKAIRPDELAQDIEFTDTLFALRRLAAYYFLSDQSEKLDDLDQRAKELLEKSYSQIGHVHQLAIRALCEYQQGYYQDAFESSRIALSLSEKNGLASVHVANDARYILARCKYEFTDYEEALGDFEEVIASSEKNEQWIWHCAATSLVAMHRAEFGEIVAALQLINEARERVQRIHHLNYLSSLIDRGEMAIRLITGEFDRIKLLINTSLPGEIVQSMKFVIQRQDGENWYPIQDAALPEKTPRQKIYKLLNQTILALDTDEDEAILHLSEALRIGSEVGAKADFLSQVNLYPLFHKIAQKTPTFYHEDISRKAALRMQEINASKNIKPELTKREIEIVKHLDSGKPITAIGASLHISHNTMKTHLKNVYRKLGADGRDQAVEKAKSLGLI
jgi:ATP/maltotriose-dependent transcriptional regulator MalT